MTPQEEELWEAFSAGWEATGNTTDDMTREDFRFWLASRA